jgi:N-acetylated-alpha-linked acidic dipeptidase
MSSSSAGRRLAAVVLSATAFAAVASAASAQAPISGFTERSAEHQRAYEERFQDGVSAESIGRTSRALSRKPQLIATPGLRQSFEYSVQRLRSYGLDVSTPGYTVYASRPRDIAVTMTAPSRHRLSNKEPAFAWHRDFEDVVVAYNAYSPSGDVSGEVVYANYGLPEDYAELERLGVDVRGKIVLVRYGRSFRGVKAQQAELRGAAGLLIYSDPEDDGFVRGPVYPQGPWRPADSFQRGSIQYIFNYPGDPLTPGAASVPGTRRLDPEDAGNVPRIPTTPITYGDAQPLLEGLSGPAAPESFRGGLPITYRVGPGGTRVRLDLDIAYEQLPVRNVLAEIRGTTHPEQRVVLGAHYDGWTYGTSDNASGWSVMMEVARSLGRLLDRGWRPERTIVIAGWDGEEYGLLGSTEWVEQFQRDLARNAVAYANLDGAGGSSFGAASVPQVDDALIEVTQAVTDTRSGLTAYDVWRGEDDAPEFDRLGSGSDYTAFLDHVGVPSFEAGFTAPASSGTYHSAYDDTYNMERHLDPGYIGHAGSARVNGVAALRLANADILPFHYSDYATAVGSYVEELQQVQAETPGAARVRLDELLEAAAGWREASEALEARAGELLAAGDTESSRASRAIRRINDSLMRQERALITSKGLPGRPWFRHQVYAPGLVTGYAVQYLPGMRDALERGDEATTRRYRDLLLDSLREATRLAVRAASG